MPLVAALALAGCASEGFGGPSPLPAVVVEQAPSPVPDGAIFQDEGSNIRPLFEDVRPRAVGDVLTVVFDEQLSATRNENSNLNKSSEIKFSPKTVPAFLGGATKGLNRYGMDLEGDNTFTGGGGSTASNTLTGSVTVTVDKVLPNGDLQVEGGKRIKVNEGSEYIRFSGIVDPRLISGQDSIESTQVADANIQYVGTGSINDANRPGLFQQLMLKLWPF